MANWKLRMQIPYGINDSSQFDDDRYYPDPPWGSGTSDGNLDCPTVLKHWSGTESTMTRSVQLYDGSRITLPNANNCSASNEENFYTARTDYQCYQIDCHPKQDVNFMYGHKGPASSNSTRQSFQRNVVGLSWQFKTGDMSWSRGLEPKNVMLLYRKKDYWDRFYGVYLIKDNYWASGTKRFSQGSIWDRTQNGSYQGKISVNLLNNNADYQRICNDNYVFQSIWFEFINRDSISAQVSTPYKMWNCRLIFLDSDRRDEGSRIVLPRKWQFSSAFDRSKPLRLV